MVHPKVALLHSRLAPHRAVPAVRTFLDQHDAVGLVAPEALRSVSLDAAGVSKTARPWCHCGERASSSTA